MANNKSFEIKGFVFSAQNEELRKPRIVRIGIIQNKIVLPTTAPLADQRNAIHKRIADIISAAALSQVNIVCFQEAWSESYFIDSILIIHIITFFSKNDFLM